MRNNVVAFGGTRRHCLERHTPERSTARGPASGLNQSPQPGQRRPRTGPPIPDIHPDQTRPKIHAGG